MYLKMYYTKLLWSVMAAFLLGYSPSYGQKLPSSVAKSIISSSAVAPFRQDAFKSLQVEALRGSHLRALAKGGFVDLDEMLEDYFCLNPQSVSAAVLKENQEIQKALVQNWLERDFYAVTHSKQLQQGVSVTAVQGKINYLDYIPYNARLVMLGEIHEQDWMVREVEQSILQYKKAFPDKNVYYASEFIDAVPGPQLYILSKEKEAEIFVQKRPYYRNITKRMIAAGIRVVGLENPQLSKELVRVGYTQNFPNTQLAWKTVSPTGMRDRNMYWAKIIRRIYEQDPDAVVFVHAGFGHTDYNQPNPLSLLLKDLRPFVVEFAAPGVGDFNTLLEKHFPVPWNTVLQGRELFNQNPSRQVLYIRYMKNKRSALVGGCDLHIKKAVDPNECPEG